MVDAHRRGERPAVSPARRRLRMNPGEDHPSVSGFSFHHGRCAVGIPSDNRTPAGKLWAILPVLIERGGASTRDRHRRLTYPLPLRSIEAESLTGGQVQPVVDGLTA